MTERHAFNAEVGGLLDLVVHSLYSEREIFLPEIVANAANATDPRAFEALTDQSLALPDSGKSVLRSSMGQVSMPRRAPETPNRRFSWPGR